MGDALEIRARLTQRLAELTGEIDQIEGTFGRPLDDDFAEQAVEREDEEALDLLETSALAEAASIRAALARLDAGTYGHCRHCGEPIAAARLNALPAAAECIVCASARVAS